MSNKNQQQYDNHINQMIADYQENISSVSEEHLRAIAKFEDAKLYFSKSWKHFTQVVNPESISTVLYFLFVTSIISEDTAKNAPKGVQLAVGFKKDVGGMWKKNTNIDELTQKERNHQDLKSYAEKIFSQDPIEIIKGDLKYKYQQERDKLTPLESSNKLTQEQKERLSILRDKISNKDGILLGEAETIMKDHGQDAVIKILNESRNNFLDSAIFVHEGLVTSHQSELGRQKSLLNKLKLNPQTDKRRINKVELNISSYERDLKAAQETVKNLREQKQEQFNQKDFEELIEKSLKDGLSPSEKAKLYTSKGSTAVAAASLAAMTDKESVLGINAVNHLLFEAPWNLVKGLYHLAGASFLEVKVISQDGYAALSNAKDNLFNKIAESIADDAYYEMEEGENIVGQDSINDSASTA